MKYRKLYEVLDQRRAHNSSFRYIDHNGWKDCLQTYRSLAQPLWIIAEDEGLRYRFWIPRSFCDMDVPYAKMTPGNGTQYRYCQQCRKKSELAVLVSKLFAELDAEATAQRRKGQMDLLDKFDAVTTCTGDRTSQADKDYCEIQQKAYKATISSYKELAFS